MRSILYLLFFVIDRTSILQSIPAYVDTLVAFSKKRHAEIHPNFQRHAQTLSAIHMEMNLIMKYIKSIQSKIKKKHPEKYAQAELLFPLPADLCDE